MTDDEAVIAFQESQKNVKGDNENLHMTADDFIADILKEHGFPRLAETYKTACGGFWYA